MVQGDYVHEQELDPELGDQDYHPQCRVGPTCVWLMGSTRAELKSCQNCTTILLHETTHATGCQASQKKAITLQRKRSLSREPMECDKRDQLLSLRMGRKFQEDPDDEWRRVPATGQRR